MKKKSQKYERIVLSGIILVWLLINTKFILSITKSPPLYDPCENVTGYDNFGGDVVLSLKSICYGKLLQENKLKDIRICKPMCMSNFYGDENLDYDKLSPSDQNVFDNCKANCVLNIAISQNDSKLCNKIMWQTKKEECFNKTR